MSTLQHDTRKTSLLIKCTILPTYLSIPALVVMVVSRVQPPTAEFRPLIPHTSPLYYVVLRLTLVIRPVAVTELRMASSSLRHLSRPRVIPSLKVVILPPPVPVTVYAVDLRSPFGIRKVEYTYEEDETYRETLTTCNSPTILTLCSLSTTT